MGITWQAEDTVEPIADTTIEGIANFNSYSVTSGCGLTYSGANMGVTIAAGSVLFNGGTVAVAGNTVTLVSDATNPRWTWIGVPSGGTVDIVSGTAAATPTVPEIGDRVPLALVYVQANLAIANNATYKLDKRVLYSGVNAILTTTGDVPYASAANTPARLGIGTSGQVLTVSGGTPAWSGLVSSVGAILDGGGSDIPANTIVYVRVPFACTINEFTVLADQSGSITVKVYKDTYANYPPNASDDISNGGLALSSVVKNTDTTLSGWTTSIAAGDVIAFTNTTAATTITSATCQLKVTRN